MFVGLLGVGGGASAFLLPLAPPGGCHLPWSQSAVGGDCMWSVGKIFRLSGVDVKVSDLHVESVLARLSGVGVQQHRHHESQGKDRGS
jgi:hypothetical protein